MFICYDFIQETIEMKAKKVFYSVIENGLFSQKI